ncbi:MAG: hypothetical protein GY705_12570, partial [Bacteroidetes bacterium]|nr:hypothetical protein [Bacteroidota bacterium]
VIMINDVSFRNETKRVASSSTVNAVSMMLFPFLAFIATSATKLESHNFRFVYYYLHLISISNMAPAKKKQKKSSQPPSSKAAKKTVDDATSKALKDIDAKFQKQMQEIKELLMASKKDTIDPKGTVKDPSDPKSTENDVDASKNSKESEKLDGKKGSDGDVTITGGKTPEDSVPTGNKTNSESNNEEIEEKDVGAALQTILGVHKGNTEKIKNDNAVYQPYLIRGATVDKKLKA